MRSILWFLAAPAALVAAGWAGLQVKPQPFPQPPFQGLEPDTVALPDGLPAPVDRFLRITYGGNRIPILSTMVLSGRARIRPAGPWYLPARFRFVHNVGRDYRHYFEVTWFGVPILKVNEGYVDGMSFFDAPLVGAPANHPKLSQGANLTLWAETLMFPAALVLDPRVSWEGVDDTTARLTVPFGDDTETILVRFDPGTGLATGMECMRYRSTTDTKKILWQPTTDEYADNGGVLVGVVGSARWADQEEPWATFRVEDVITNADIGDYIHARSR